MKLVADFAANRVGYEIMPPIHHLLKECWRHGVYIVGGKDSRRLKIDEIRLSRLFVVVGRTGEVKVVPELRRINAGILHLRQRHLVRMDVVHCEKAGNTLAPRRRRNKSRHPIVAVNEIRLHSVHYVVYHFTLESEGQLSVSVALGIHVVAIVETTVFS